MLYQSYYKHDKPDDKAEIFDIFEKYSPYDVAGLLKLFLRELTKPLFTNELMEIFLKVPGKWLFGTSDAWLHETKLNVYFVEIICYSNCVKYESLVSKF